MTSTTALSGMQHLRSGKVRDIYDAGDDRYLIVASDRVSTFDAVHPTPVPDKGRVLTGVSAFWFDLTKDLVDNHVISFSTTDFPGDAQPHAEELRGRTMLVRQAEVIPFECVARGYLTGSGLKDYQATGEVCGLPLPSGLVEASQLPEPIFTPATKAETGHDENVSFEVMSDALGAPLAFKLRELTLALYRAGHGVARDRGIILADTKFEFGLIGDDVILIDEVLTPDSSRYWPLDGYEAGKAQPSYDKQPVRDYASSTGWDKNPPAPPLPPEVVDSTRARYVELYERLTGDPFDAWLKQT